MPLQGRNALLWRQSKRSAFLQDFLHEVTGQAMFPVGDTCQGLKGARFKKSFCFLKVGIELKAGCGLLAGKIDCLLNKLGANALPTERRVNPQGVHPQNIMALFKDDPPNMLGLMESKDALGFEDMDSR